MVFDKGEDCVGIKSDLSELKKIFVKNDITTSDKAIIYFVCLNMPNEKIGKVLEDILEKFYLNMDIINKSDDFAMAEVILSKLSAAYGEQFRKR